MMRPIKHALDGVESIVDLISFIHDKFDHEFGVINDCGWTLYSFILAIKGYSNAFPVNEK